LRFDTLLEKGVKVYMNYFGSTCSSSYPSNKTTTKNAAMSDKDEDKYRSQIDRVNVVLDIVKQLKNYPTQNMGPVDLYKDEYVYVQKLKKIFSDYIKQPQDDLKQFKGAVFFEETVKRDAEYILPVLKTQEPLFVIRMKTKRV
jgi:hypothetical protein